MVHAAMYALVTPDNPAAAGEAPIIFGTVAGSFDAPPPTGAAASASPLARTSVTPSVTVAGAPAEVGFSGLAPGYPGLLQINIALPAPLPPGGDFAILSWPTSRF